MKQRQRSTGLKSTDKMLLGILGIWLMLVAGSAYSLRAEMGAWSKAVKGDGNITEEQRALEPFSGIELRGSVVLHYQPGQAAGCRVKADANLLPLIETPIEDGQLNIVVRGNTRPSHRIELRCQSAELKSVTSRGASGVNLADLNGSELELSIQGTGDIVVNGQTTTVKAHIQGTGEINLEELVAAQADLSIQGTGTIRAGKAAKANVSIAGTGNVHVAEGTEVDQISIRGTGQLKRD